MQRFLALVLLLVALVPHTTIAEVRVVKLHNFYFEPKDLTINQGDTVRFIWVDAFHDAVAGNPPGLPTLPFQNAFRTPIDDMLPFQSEVTFSRDLLVRYPAPLNRYDYYCTPHFTSGMIGSITVNRTPQSFAATLTGWQQVPINNSLREGGCTATLNGEETELRISCAHAISGGWTAELRNGLLGEEGALVCDLGSTPGEVVCPLSQEQANRLWDGGHYVTVRSSAFPKGELRGQLYRTSTNRTITGRVTFSDGSAVRDATVSDGTRSGTTDSAGFYTIKGVPSGVFRLTAQKSGYRITPVVGSSPLLVNANNPSNINFVATVGQSCTRDQDGDGVCDEDERADGSNELDPGSYRERLRSPIRVLWNGFIDILNIAAILNRAEEPAVVTASVYNMLGQEVHRQAIVVPAQGEFDLIINDLPGFQKDSLGILVLSFPEQFNGKIDGQNFYYRLGADKQSYEFAFGVPFVPPLYGESAVAFNTFQPSLNPAEAAHQVAQWLSIVNLDTRSAQRFTVERFSQAGVALSSTEVVVPPFGRVDLEGGHVSPGPSAVGLHRISPESNATPYLAQLYRYGGDAPEGVPPPSYSFAFPLLARSGSGESQYAPISTGGGGENWVEVANTSAQSTEVVLEFFDTAGALRGREQVVLAPREQRHFNAGAVLGADASGTVQVHPSQRASVLGMSMFYFRDPATGSITSMYGTPLREPFSDELFGSYNLFLQMANWLKLSNTRSESIETTLTVYPPGASPVSRTFLLPPFGGIEVGLHEPQFGTAIDSYGAFKVTSEEPGVVLGELLRVRILPNGGIDFASPVPVR